MKIKIPDKVKIGALTYEVIITDQLIDKNDSGGQTDSIKLTLKISKGHPDAMAQIFMHEVFHTFNIEFNNEVVIENFTNSFLQFVQDNPGVFDANSKKS